MARRRSPSLKKTTGNLRYTIEGVNAKFATDAWTPRHDMIALLYASGMRVSEIAEQLGYHPNRVSLILSDPRAAERIAHYRERVVESMADVGLKLKALALEALDTAAYWMRSRDPKLAPVSARSAFGILDRAGFSKVEKHLVASVDIPPERLNRLEELARAAKEAREQFNYGDGNSQST
jgi:hypothetical protein